MPGTSLLLGRPASEALCPANEQRARARDLFRRISRARFTLALAATLSTLATGAHAGPPPPVNFFGIQKTPLLYLTTSITTQAINQAPQTTQQQTYIFRDGTVLAAATAVDASTYGPSPSYASLWSLKLTPARLTELRTAINAAKAGSLRDCSQRAFPTPGNLSHDTVFTWFGRDTRKNTFIVRQAADQNCPLEVYQLLLSATTVGGGRFTDAPTNFALPPVVVTGD